MKSIAFLAVLLALTLGVSPVPALAQEKGGALTDEEFFGTKPPPVTFEQVTLATTQSVGVEIVDSTRGGEAGCLPRPEVVRAAVELEARSKGVGVISGEGFLSQLAAAMKSVNIHINALELPNGACAGSLRLTLAVFMQPQIPYTASWREADEKGLVIAPVWERSYMLAALKGGFQSQVKETSVEAVQALLNEMYKARAEVFTLRPDIKDRYEKSLAP